MRGSSAAARIAAPAPSEIPSTATLSVWKASPAVWTASTMSRASVAPRPIVPPPLSPDPRRSKSNALYPASCRNLAQGTISARDVLKPWTRTTAGAPGRARASQARMAVPSRSVNVTSATARPLGVAGVACWAETSEYARTIGRSSHASTAMMTMTATAGLTRQRVFESLSGREKAAEEAPLRGAETMPCEQDVPAPIDPEADDPDQKTRLGPVEDAALPSNRKRVVDPSERAHQHAATLGD